MGLGELFVLAIGVSMDAFAVAVCKGLALKKLKWFQAIIVGLWFGFFQAAMPLIGYFLGIQFQKQITSIDHWIAFVLLSLIGGNMVKEACSKDEDEACGCNTCTTEKGKTCVSDNGETLDVKTMFPLAVATSVDALAVGITLAFLDVSIVPAVSFIGVITFLCSAVGVYIGHVFGAKYKSKAEFAGGMILILIGLKILLEHTGILSF